MAEITIRLSDKMLKISAAVVALILVSWTFLQLWESGVFRQKYHLQMYLSEADGLSVGSPVRVDGMDVGKVQAKNLAQTSANPTRTILIELRIEKRYKNMIRSDSSASLVAEGLLGNQYVDIERGFNGTPLTDGEELATMPSKKVTPQEFWTSLAKVAECMKETKESINNAAPTAAASPLKRTP